MQTSYIGRKNVRLPNNDIRYFEINLFKNKQIVLHQSRLLLSQISFMHINCISGQKSVCLLSKEKSFYLKLQDLFHQNYESLSNFVLDSRPKHKKDFRLFNRSKFICWNNLCKGCRVDDFCNGYLIPHHYLLLQRI